MLEAYAELAAIAQAFGAKDAIKKLGRSLRAKSAEGDAIAELRRRLAPMIRQGLVREK